MAEGTGAATDGFENEKAIGREAHGLMRESLEGGDKEAGDEEHETAERDLRGDECIHQTAAGVRIFSTLERTGGLNGGGAKSGEKSEETGDDESEREHKEEDADIGGKGEADGIVRATETGNNERSRPHGKERAESGGDEGEDGALDQDELQEVAASSTDGNAESHFARAGGGLRDHEVGDVGASDEQNEKNENGESEERGANVLLETRGAGGSGVEAQGLVEVLGNLLG